MNERSKINLRLILTHILPVIVLIFLSFFLSKYSLLVLSLSLFVLIITFFTGYWEFFGIKFKWLYTSTLILTIAAVITYAFIRKSNIFPKEVNTVTFFALSILLIYMAFQLVKILMVIFENTENSYEIEFPYKTGRYLITDGGNSRISRMMNYHYFSAVHKKNKTNSSMLYATDIVKLSEGNKKFLPTKNEDYPIFNESIYSPMEGIIFKIVSGIPDNEPFSGNYPYNAGNTVVIKNGDHYFLLGHLKSDGIQVREGDKILKGQYIGRTGNSGYSERPHLHMQLIKCENENYWYGKGVSIKFKNKNLYKNRMIVVNDVK